MTCDECHGCTNQKRPCEDCDACSCRKPRAHPDTMIGRK